MKTRIMTALATTLLAGSAFAADLDCGSTTSRELAACQDNQTLVTAYHAALIASADGALKDGLRNRIARIELSVDEQASRIRQLIDDGRISAATLSPILDEIQPTLARRDR